MVCNWKVYEVFFINCDFLNFLRDETNKEEDEDDEEVEEEEEEEEEDEDDDDNNEEEEFECYLLGMKV